MRIGLYFWEFVATYGYCCGPFLAGPEQLPLLSRESTSMLGITARALTPAVLLMACRFRDLCHVQGHCVPSWSPQLLGSDQGWRTTPEQGVFGIESSLCLGLSWTPCSAVRSSTFLMTLLSDLSSKGCRSLDPLREISILRKIFHVMTFHPQQLIAWASHTESGSTSHQ